VAARIKRLRQAKGPRRPQYLASPDADRAVMMLLALASEVSALRERLDTHERLAELNQPPLPAAIEAYEPAAEVEAARAAARRSLIDRIARVLLEPQTKRRTAAASDEPSEKTFDEPSDNLSDKPSDKHSEKHSDKASDKHSDKASDKASDEPSDNPFSDKVPE